MADLTIEERVSQLESDFLYFKAAGQTRLQNSASACQEAAASAKITADAAGEALSTIKNVTTDTYAKDVEVVHLSGNEGIGGIKKIERVTSESSYPIIFYLPNVKADSTNTASFSSNIIYRAGADNANLGVMEFRVVANDYNALVLKSFSPLGESGEAAVFIYNAVNGDRHVSVTGNLVAPNNLYTLGAADTLWKDIYCASATINTSDERLKMEIAEYPDELLDAWGDVAYRQFIFKDAYQKKGDDARTHTGLITQQIEAALIAHGVDPEKYGLFCYDKWDSKPEIKDRDGNVIQQAQEAGEKYGLRYTECLCVEAAYQRRRADRLEARLAKLEAIVENLASQE